MKGINCLMAAAILYGVNVLAAPEQDLVTDLPGLTWKPDFKHYSGYLDVPPNGSVHYWLVESASSPRHDPLVIMLGNLPRCNPMISLMDHPGPFLLQKDGKTILKNPHSWNTLASLLYLELPYRFSFSYNYTEKQFESQMPYAVVNGLNKFYQKFPEYKENDFYIESITYAADINVWSSDIFLNVPHFNNFKGVVLVHGEVPRQFNDNAIVYIGYYFGIIEWQTYHDLLIACCKTLDVSYCDFHTPAQKPGWCSRLYGSKVGQIIGYDLYNPHNMYLPLPYGVVNGKSMLDSETTTKNVSGRSVDDLLHQRLSPIPNDMKWNPCANVKLDYMSSYFNLASVKKAIHVDQGKTWKHEDDDVLFYAPNHEPVIKRYAKIFQHPELRMLMIYGDVALGLPAIGMEWYLESTSLKVTRPRSYWFYQEDDGTTQTGGISIKFNNTEFYTVKGSGSLVTRDKPKQALQLLSNFIRRK